MVAKAVKKAPARKKKVTGKVAKKKAATPSKAKARTGAKKKVAKPVAAPYQGVIKLPIRRIVD